MTKLIHPITFIDKLVKKNEQHHTAYVQVARW